MPSNPQLYALVCSPFDAERIRFLLATLHATSAEMYMGVPLYEDSTCPNGDWVGINQSGAAAFRQALADGLSPYAAVMAMRGGER